MNLLTSRLIKEEKLNKIHSQPETQQSESAFAAKDSNPFKQSHVFRGYRGNSGRGRGRGRGSYQGGNRSWVICHFCGFPGHVIANCRKRMREEKTNDKSEKDENQGEKNENQDFGYSSLVNLAERR